MTSRLRHTVCFGLLLAGAGAAAVAQQGAFAGEDVGAARQAMEQARVQGEAARKRAEQLEIDAVRVTSQADRTAREAAALAARIQQTEAVIAGHEAQAALIAQEQRRMRARLAERQQPLVRLTAALQRLSRRPPVLALLRPGSVRDTMHMRALLSTLLPQVEQRTAALRGEIERSRALRARALLAARELRTSETQLHARRRSLAALESRQRLESRQANSIADREAERALALAERTQDLGALVRDLGKAGELRAQLAALPGPVPRPLRPEASQVLEAQASFTPAAAPQGYLLPVSGRLVTGFGVAAEGQPRSRGIALAVRQGAQIVAPAPGRVAFAGPFRGYGRIVIIEHDGGWTSLVTGLARLDAAVGATLVAGSPLGVAGGGNPIVTLELRRDGEPVNPLQFIGGL